MSKTSVRLVVENARSCTWVTCDHALSLYLCNLCSGGGHDTFLLQITCRKARIWTFFSDWIGNNTDDLRCSDWPKRRHPLGVVDFSLHFCLRYEQWIHTRVRYEISAGSVFLPVWKMSKEKFHPLKYFPFHRMLKIAVKNSPIIWMQFDTGYKLQKRQTGSLFK